METHIGNLVSAKMQEMHISIKTLSERLNMSRMNVHDILKRKTMQTDLLAQIGKAMNYDFFQHYSVTAEEVQKTKSELMSRNLMMEKRLQEAEVEISILNRIIDTLKLKG